LQQAGGFTQQAGSTTAGSVNSASSQSVGSPAGASGGSNVGTQSAANAGTAQFDINGNLTGGGTPLNAVAGGASPAPTQSGGIGSALSSGLNKVISNPGALLSGGALAADAIKQELGPAPKGTRQLQDIAGQELGQGQQLQSYLQNGTLPPGVQQGINQSTNAAKAAIRSRYASMGQSGSSAEQQELSAVDAQAQAQGAQIAMGLLNTGINETGMSAGLYEEMLKNTLSSDQELGKAFGSFASSLSGVPTKNQNNNQNA
jgi:hypothetical protein